MDGEVAHFESLVQAPCESIESGEAKARAATRRMRGARRNERARRRGVGLAPLSFP
jgi:hypothetical protein